MKIVTLKILRWLTIVVALILSIDALLAIYKTIEFRNGIESEYDFFGVLLVCFALLTITVMTGLGALVGTLKSSLRLSERILLGIAICVGIIFLLMNLYVFSEWIQQAISSKSESVLICLTFSCLLMFMTLDKKVIVNSVK